MKIAFTHNLQMSSSEEEAEFDKPETVLAITTALRNLGHTVEPVDVSGPASRVVVRLEALNPDLVFNTAEGSQGRFREAFYPALFDRLGLPYTFSDAYVCTLTLDKQFTKMIVRQSGIATPDWIFVDKIEKLKSMQMSLNFPLFVKPNFEGSSKGITRESIVETFDQLIRQSEKLLSRYPEGLIIEEFIDGFDLTVPYLEKASPETFGILEPAQYAFSKNGSESQIYDYDKKSVDSDFVTVRVPADISQSQKSNAINFSRKIIDVIGIRDAARIDYRVDKNGKLYFIEINALPSLEPGASIYESASFAGLKTVDSVLDSIVQTASERFNISAPHFKKRKPRSKITVGLIYNLRKNNNFAKDTVDDEAEYDSADTIAAIKSAIESYDHQVVQLEATPELPSLLPGSGIDMAFNIAEGIEGRTRESQVPALLELLGIPYTGSDPTTLSLAMDKGLSKRVVLQAGLLTPPFILLASGKERLPKNFTFPAIIKPVAEGSSKGILKASVVETEDQLRKQSQEIAAKYKQPVLAESFLCGREFTVAMLGEKRPRVLPPLEVIFTEQNSRFPIYSFERKFQNQDIKFEVPANIEPSLRRDMEKFARNVFTILGCRDLARVDLRMDERGRINFIECNPLPGLTPDFSDFCVIANAAGISYRMLIGEIMAPAIRRLREKEKDRLISGGIS